MLKHGAITEQIIRVYYDVYNELGHGFLEAIYERAMSIALTENALSVEHQLSVPIWFRGHMIGDFHPDLVVNRAVVVELKAARTLDASHEAQLIHYLRATELEVGLLLNFGHKPQFRRLVLDNDKKEIRVNPCKSVAN